jgi:CubicO group peptidase (beta-lactamase class C family)
MNNRARVLPVLLALPLVTFANQALAADPESAAARVQQRVLPAHYLEAEDVGMSIARAMLEQDIPGLAIAFVDHGEIAWQLDLGYADLATATPVTSRTLFAAASLSKPVAAITSLALVDEGRLELDADIDGQLRGWQLPESEFTAREKVTLRRLIGHTAGIRNHLFKSFEPGAALPDTVQMLSGQPPSADPAIAIEAVPGERYRYSNPGYTIVQKLIEDASGQTFSEAVTQRVFTPLGMHESSFAQPLPKPLKSRVATGHAKDLSAYPHRNFPFLAAGGLWSTPADLARFMAALMADARRDKGTILSSALADEVFARTELRLGFGKKLGPGDALVFEHWGSNAGFTSYMVGSLADEQGLVIMSNSDRGFDLMASIARSVAREYDWPLLQPKVYEAMHLPVEQLLPFAGSYGTDAAPQDALEFSVIEATLQAREAGAGAAQPLVPVGESSFIAPAQNTLYEFIRGGDQRIRWVRVTLASGYNTDLPRR